MTGAGRATWLLSLGLAAAGGLAAHAVGYRIAEPHDERRSALLEQTGHGYFDPVLLGSLCLALAAVGFLGRVLAGGRPGRTPPLWLFALAPPVVFAVQEHAERALHHEALLHAVLEPAFLAGLALQLPFALVAFAVARGLHAAAGALARRVGAAPRPKLVSDASLALPGSSWVPVNAPFGGGCGQRAPPLLSLS